ncbi:unnamed protein product [Dovyalis caffra]|uniref:Uncharacterized protein n=1 Tax=Dovyalis caffra TaxID=77055 RepID=A0AAV1QTN3_9ROSI|nr:unnamed protein product [Dovyalis caffra]
MAEKDQTEIGLEIQALLLNMADCNKTIDRKFVEFLLRNKHEAEAIQAEIEALKKFQENENKRRTALTAQFHQPDESWANLEVKKEDTGGIIGFNPSGDSGYGERGEQEMSSLSGYSRETEDLKKRDSVQEESVRASREQERQRMVLGNGDNEKGSDVNKLERPVMPSSTSDIRDAEEDTKKSVPGSGEGNESKKEGYVKLTNGVKKVERLKRKKVKFVLPESSYKKLTFHTKIKEFSGKIRPLMRKFKKVQHDVEKISLVKWLNGYVKSPEDWESAKTMKATTVKLAAKLSNLLVNLMFFLSDMKEMASKFQALNSSLKWLNEDGDYIVTSRIHALLDFIDQEIRSEQRSKKLESDEGNSMTKHVDRDSNALKEGLFDENQVNQLIHQFFNEILRLENILKHQGESDTKMSLKYLSSSLESDLKECERELNKIESRMNELKALCGCNLRADDLNMDLKIELKINELWDLKEDANQTRLKKLNSS